MSTWYADLAWLGDRVAPGVVVQTRGDRITAVTPDCHSPPREAVRLRGLTIPGMANAHSHAFHRVLRGRAQSPDRGTFWTWRERMYEVAARLTPESYLALARATYAEMALAGITCVGEFHYVHHQPGGAPYADPNAMGAALVQAAYEAGIRLTLLDTCYLSGGFGAPLAGPQLRFGDGTAEGWAARVDALRLPQHARLGAAVHSVRAVAPEQARVVAEWARERALPLHVHVAEQPAENEDCISAYGQTPAQVLAGAGVLGPAATAVHATHLTDTDVALLGSSLTTICVCPTTERDLADGIGPMPELSAAGSPLALGSDSHAVVDLFEESRAVELNERVRSGIRGHWSARQLLSAATEAGHSCLGWPEGGRLEAGAIADMVTLALDTPRLAGATKETALEAAAFAGTAADVRHVVSGGRQLVADGRHCHIDVPAALEATLRPA